MRWRKLTICAYLASCALPTSSKQAAFSSNNALDRAEQRTQDQISSAGKIIDDELYSYVEGLTQLWEAKGTAVAIIRPDGEVEFGAWGVKSEDGEKMTPETLFHIGSCSKAFLSATIGILMDDFEHGRNKTPLPPGVESFTWNTKVKNLLPDEWKLQDPWSDEKADILDILSHLSGLPRHDLAYRREDEAADVIKRLNHLRPAHELRQKSAYNNQMYMAGAHIVKKYSPTHDYPTYIKERIFAPLGMSSATFSPSVAVQTGKLSQSWSAHSQRIPFWYDDGSVDMIGGPGGVITNVVDLAKWLTMLLNKGVDPSANVTILPRSVFEKVTTSNTIVNGKPPSKEFSIAGYGMGWLRQTFKGYEIVEHNGGLPGFSSLIAFFPNENLGIAVLINTADKAPVNRAILLRIAEDVLGLDHSPRAEDPKAAYRKQPSRPANASVPLPLLAYAGTYRSPGYGAFTLCAPSSTSHYCSSVLEDFTLVDSAQNKPLPPNATTPQLFAEWSRFWSSHVRMVHFEENTFQMGVSTLFPHGYGASSGAFELYPAMDIFAGNATFLVEDGKVLGFGFSGNDDPSMRRALGDAKGLQESSIAWFDKV